MDTFPHDVERIFAIKFQMFLSPEPTESYFRKAWPKQDIVLHYLNDSFCLFSLL